MKKYKILTGIYKITSPTGRIYIGQTVNFTNRCNNYKNIKELSPRHDSIITRSLLKYGYENHKIEFIEACLEDELDEREILQIEIHKCWILKYPKLRGMNLLEGGKIKKEDFADFKFERKNYKFQFMNKVLLTECQNDFINRLNHPYNLNYKAHRLRMQVIMSYINTVWLLSHKPVSINSKKFQSILGLAGRSFTKLKNYLTEESVIIQKKKPCYRGMFLRI